VGTQRVQTKGVWQKRSGTLKRVHYSVRATLRSGPEGPILAREIQRNYSGDFLARPSYLTSLLE
jgi:hypothetical protein